jgi:hypothetical protein
MVLPPDARGAFQETNDEPSMFEVAFTDVGALGAIAGVAGAEGVEAEPEPRTFVAVTVKV